MSKYFFSPFPITFLVTYDLHERFTWLIYFFVHNSFLKLLKFYSCKGSGVKMNSTIFFSRLKPLGETSCNWRYSQLLFNIVSLILLNSGHVFRFCIVGRLMMRERNTCPKFKRISEII